MLEIKGNLLDFFDDAQLCINAGIPPIEIMVHGANCQAVMGAGIAAQIKSRYPEMFAVDTKANVYAPGDIRRLGGYSAIQMANRKIGINLYSQFYGGSNADLCAIRLGLKKINNRFPGFTIGLPLIGCGIGGLKWDDVKKVIEEELVDMQIVIVHFDNTYLKDSRYIAGIDPYTDSKDSKEMSIFDKLLNMFK